jgi:hypothetical protein
MSRSSKRIEVSFRVAGCRGEGREYVILSSRGLTLTVEMSLAGVVSSLFRFSKMSSSRRMEKSFRGVCDRGEEERVRDLVRQGVDINSRDESGWSGLIK